MTPTVLTYMDNQTCVEASAQVVAVEMQEDRVCVLLDQTIFYPQGGGQACDQGKIIAGDGVFAVQDVRFVDGFVHHYGAFDAGSFAVGARVECSIDSERRRLNSRLHSAGHLLDEAVKNLGYGWTPTKGIHFPGQMAVEYSGVLDDGEVARAAIEAEANRLIQNAHPICAQMVTVADLPVLADYVPPNLPENKPVRIVTIARDKGTPCGGTHVPTTADIGRLVIRYVKAKKGSIKVSYDVVA